MSDSRGPVRYTNIDAPPDNGCDGCADLKSVRVLCPAHRDPSRPCLWCAGRGWAVGENRWKKCSH